MKKIDLDQMITILANIGVIAGIIFLSIEISQSNRIATYETRNALIENTREIFRATWESPEVAEFMLKLTTRGQELTLHDQLRADNLAQMVINHAADVVVVIESGFIPDDIAQRYIESQTVFINQYPGLAVYIRQSIDAHPGVRAATGPGGPLIFRSLRAEVDRIELD